MFRLRSVVCGLVAALAVAPTVSGQGNPVRIMVLGDSITGSPVRSISPNTLDGVCPESDQTSICVLGLLACTALAQVANSRHH